MSNQNQQMQNILNLREIIQNVKFPKMRRFLEQARSKNIYTESGNDCPENPERSSFCPIKDIAEENLRMLKDINTGKSLIRGVATGFEELDRMTSGLQNSDLIVISGYTGIGKTAFVHNISQYVTLETKIPVAYFSLELSKNQLFLRILASEARVDLGRICKGFLGKDNWIRLKTASEKISSSPLYIFDTPAITIHEVQTTARRMKANEGLGLIIVDNIQLMQAEGFRNTRDREISEITHSLKALAMELQIPVIAISQLNRRADNSQTLHPNITDLRDSGAIEQDANVILFICRDKIRKKNIDIPEEKITEIVIAKHSNGPTGSFKLAFLERFTRFENFAPMGREVEEAAKNKIEENLAAIEAAFKSEF